MVGLFGGRFSAHLKAAFFVLICSLCLQADAYKLRPTASTAENRIRSLEGSKINTLFDDLAKIAVDHFSTPVHEEITYRIYGCNSAPPIHCVDGATAGSTATEAILYGVQWNDNPPFQISTSLSGCPSGTTTIRLPNFSECWIKLFKDAEKNAARTTYDGASGHALLYRVHFGDLQFLHAMAIGDGETSKDTKAKIMAWAALMYRISIDDFDPSTRVAASGIPEIDGIFARNGWTVTGMLTLGQDPKLVKEVKDVAFGSLLHMLQDSFANGHVQRDTATVGSCPGFPGLTKAGDIVEFHAYNNQDKGEHGKKDSRNYMESNLTSPEPTIVSLGRALVEMRQNKTPWSTVSKYLGDCVFPLPSDYAAQNHRAGPGTDILK